jgi:hypothetical protein
MHCNIEKNLFYTEEIHKEIVKNSPELFIEGLTFEQQREIVTYTANNFYRNALNSKGEGKKYTDKNLSEELLSDINSKIKSNEASLASLSLVKANVTAAKEVFEFNNSALKIARDNISQIVKMSIKHLKDNVGLKINKEIKVEDDAPVTEESIEDSSPMEDIVIDDSEFTELDAERTTFSDNYSIETDSKKKLGGRMKAFFSFIRKSKFDKSGNLIPERTFFGAHDFMDFNIVYDELHRLLENVYPSYESILEALKKKHEEVKKLKNSNLAWLGDLIAQMDVETEGPNKGKYKLDEYTRYMFVRDMAKHKIDMLFVYQFMEKQKDGSFKSTLTIKNENENSAYRRVLNEWSKYHLKSPMVTTRGFYDPEKIGMLINDLNEAIKSKDETKAVAPIKNAFFQLGLDLPENFLNAFFNRDISIKREEKKDKDTSASISLAKMLVYELKLMQEGKKADSNFINTTFFKSLARAVSSFSKGEFSNVFRVVDKLIYTYTNNHHLANKIKDLKTNKKGILQELKKEVFSSRSLYRELLDVSKGETDLGKSFEDWFTMQYVSLQPILKKEQDDTYDRSDELTKLSEVDLEMLLIGYATRNYNNSIETDTKGPLEGLSYSKGSFLLPTFSDKSRGMLLNGLMINAAKENDKGNGFLFSEASINLYYEKIVRAEISRIIASDSAYVDALDLDTYKGDLFYMTPYLNDMFVKKDGTLSSTKEEGDIKLVDYLINLRNKSNLDIKTGIQTVSSGIKTAIKSDLKSKASSRLNEWISMGLVDTNYNLIHAQNINSEKSDVLEGRYSATELAFNLTFSEELNAANFFQLVVGDPAQFYKRDVAGTNSNITKRLANEIAPGEEADYSETPFHRQVFIEDLIGESKVIEDIVKVLDGIEGSTFRAMQQKYELLSEKVASAKKDENREDTTEDEIALSDITRKLESMVSAPYFSFGKSKMTSTDGQEYVTWKTHLMEMKRYGELSSEEYQLAYDTINSGKELTGDVLKKVLGPRKPVYANTELVNVDSSGTRKFYRKTYIKSSTFPLLPQIYNGDLQLSSIAKAAEKLEKDENGNFIPVRIAYSSAVKVGNISEPAVIFDEKGNILKDLDFSKSYRTLDSSGLRIQQSVPFKEDKDHTTKGSQESKLLFANLLKKTFTFRGNTYNGRRLRDIYNSTYEQLYKLGLEDLEDFITIEKITTHPDGSESKNRVVDNRKLARLLLTELERRKEGSITLKNGLRINKKGEFEVPLWASDYADNYMALINSVVKRFILKQDMPGTSSVLGAEIGFKAWEGTEEFDKNGGIMYTDSFNPEVGLLPQRIDPKTGEVLPAQVLLPFKFRGSDGKLLDVKDFLIKGTNRIDTSKLPKELLLSPSFRIPTQLQQSMSVVEIVGFIPYASGDLVIAPQDFVVQMGSDFDVDKLYSYMKNYKYNEETKSIEKIKEISTEYYTKKVLEIDEHIEKLYSSKKELVDSSIKDRIKEERAHLKEQLKGKNVSKATKALMLGKALKESIPQLKTEVKSSDEVQEVLQKIKELEEERDELKELYRKNMQNTIVEIHESVLLGKEAMSSVIKPLTSGKFPEMAQRIDKAYNKNKAVDSIISRKYHNKKLEDGSAGKDGISIFSSDSIFNALSQGNKSVISEYYPALDEKGKAIIGPNGPIIELLPISTRHTRNKDGSVNTGVRFGNKYKDSSGVLSEETSLKKENPGLITALIVGLQNISVDNANLEYMAKINLNEKTAGVYALLSMLGFEEEITSAFMSQPIIKKYIKLLNNAEGSFSGSSKLTKEDIFQQLLQEFSPPKEVKGEDGKVTALIPTYIESMHEGKADFEGIDAFEAMMTMIESPEEYGSDFGVTQVALLSKYILLSDHSRSIGAVKQLLNLDSKGLHKNFYVTKKRSERADKLQKSKVVGSNELLGNYAKEEGIFVEPTTQAGFDTFYGANALLKYFGGKFIETSGFFETTVEALQKIKGRDLNESELYDLRNEYVHFLQTNFVSENVDELRDKLFFETGRGSLYSNLLALKETEFGKTNKFIQSLDIKVEDETVVIDYNRIAGDSYDDNAIYASFISLLQSNLVLPSGINPSHIAQQLVYYSLIKGGRKGTSFKKFIPAEILSKILKTGSYVDVESFLNQYVRNHPDKIRGVLAKDFTPMGEGNYSYDGGDPPLYLNIIKYNEETKSPYKVMLRNIGENLFVPIQTNRGKAIKVYSFNKETKNVSSINEDKASYKENRNRLAKDIADNKEDIKTLKDLLNFVEIDNVPTELLPLFLSYKAMPGNDQVPIVFSDKLGENVAGEFKPGKVPSITINNNITKLNKHSDTHLLKTILHEQIHLLTYRTINSQLDPNLQGKVTNTPEVIKAIENMQQLMANGIDAFAVNDNMKNTFKLSIFANYREASLDTLEMLKRISTHALQVSAYKELIEKRKASLAIQDLRTRLETTTNPEEREKINQDISYFTKVSSFTEMELAKMRGITGMANSTYLYSLSNIHEFVAHAGSEPTMLKTNLGKKIWEAAKQLYRSLLKALGLNDEFIESIIADVLTISQVELVMPDMSGSGKTKTFNNYMPYNGDVIKPKGTVFVNQINQMVIMEPDIFKQVLKEYIESFIDSAKDWKTVWNNKVDSNKYDYISEMIRDFKKDIPIDKAAIALSVLNDIVENGESKRAKRDANTLITDLYKRLGIDRTFNPEQNEEAIVEPVKKEKTPVNTEIVSTEAPDEFQAYLEKVAKFSNKVIGNNDVSKSLKDKLDNDSILDNINLKSLVSLGKELISKCGGGAKTGSRWTAVDANPSIYAEHGLVITKPYHYSGETWSLSNAKIGQHNMKYGGIVQARNHGIKSDSWSLVGGKSDKKDGAYIKNSNNFVGGKWELVKDLEGPSHANGGIKLKIGDEGVQMVRGETSIKAEYGVHIMVQDTPTETLESTASFDKTPQRVLKKKRYKN